MAPLTKEQASAAFRDHEEHELYHTVWTFRAPYIRGVCNCDRTDCLGLKMQLGARIPILFRAEYVAAVDPDLCTGCRECLRLCPFGALSYSPTRSKVSIDDKLCFGICCSACPQGALSLFERSAVPATRNLWV